MAGPGEILCTAEIAELYEEASMDADVLTLKGKSEPIRVFRA
jgi:class 3 adenylate cyclase